MLRFLLGCLAVPLLAQTPGQPLPAWTPGTLEIHQISTGRGNAGLFILPDGTTLLVDAGALPTTGPATRYFVPARPDASRRPGEWIAQYIKHALRHDSTPRLDYFFLTHFHSDHMGLITPDSPTATGRDYKLTGITDVAEQLPIGTILDRAWPDYNYPGRFDDSSAVTNYRAYLAWAQANRSLKVERIAPGRASQITLRRKPGSYPNLVIRPVVANGEVWTGIGEETRQLFPPLETIPAADRPSENMCSAALKLSFGKFDYFTGGDITGQLDAGEPAWHDVETAVGQAVGPVEVSTLNHHGYIDSQNANFVAAVRPRIWIFPAWSSDHPTIRVLRYLTSPRIYPGPRDLFATSIHEANLIVNKNLERVASQNGHIVIRVAAGGSSYQVITLDDSSTTYHVKQVFGPYAAN
jgi:beta-lactamase superfamily II metal-dependent hydrolase